MNACSTKVGGAGRGISRGRENGPAPRKWVVGEGGLFDPAGLMSLFVNVKKAATTPGSMSSQVKSAAPITFLTSEQLKYTGKGSPEKGAIDLQKDQRIGWQAGSPLRSSGLSPAGARQELAGIINREMSGDAAAEKLVALSGMKDGTVEARHSIHDEKNPGPRGKSYFTKGLSDSGHILVSTKDASIRHLSIDASASKGSAARNESAGEGVDHEAGKAGLPATERLSGARVSTRPVSRNELKIGTASISPERTPTAEPAGFVVTSAVTAGKGVAASGGRARETGKQTGAERSKIKEQASVKNASRDSAGAGRLHQSPKGDTKGLAGEVSRMRGESEKGFSTEQNTVLPGQDPAAGGIEASLAGVSSTRGRIRTPAGLTGELSERVVSSVEQGLAEKIERISVGGEKEGEVSIRLYPPELGELRIKVSLKEKRVNASFIVESAAVKNAIDDGTVKLAESISREGFVLENIDVSVGGFDEHANNGDFEDMDQAVSSRPEESKARPSPPAVTASGDGIDILA